ncbi:MAG: hypothetical protein HZB26_21840, partial [Candidatus Hydrogenedentes bacterium]|nr:hypothetical protein [Candidatus Hydrogenedentota bacterium]
AALLVFQGAPDTPKSRIVLPDVPVSLATLDGHRFVVATKSKLLLVDVDSGKITAHQDAAAQDVAAAGGRIAVLMENSVALFGPSLESVSRMELSTPGRGVTFAGNRIIVVSPAAKSWQIGEATAGASVAETTPPAQKVASAPEPTPAISEVKPAAAETASPTPTVAPAQEPAQAAPAPEVTPSPQETAAPAESKSVESTPEAVVKTQPDAPSPAEAEPKEDTKAPVVLAEPNPQTSTQSDTQGKAEPASEQAAAAPEPGVARPVEPPAKVEPAQPAAEEPAAPSPKAASPEGRALRSPAPGAGEPRAPEPKSFKPSPILTGPVSEREMQQQLAGKPDMGSGEGGFAPPDWAKGLVYDADRITGDANQRHFIGNVQLQLDNMHISSDEFLFNKLTNELEATGNVVVTQELSSLTAIHLKYTLPEKTETSPANSPLELTDEEKSRLKLHSGLLEAETAHLVEPTREIFADTVHYDLAARTGDLTNAKGRMGQFYFAGQKLRVLGPASADGEDIWVTTCDRDPPHYQIRMKRAALKDGEVAEGTDAQLKLGGKNTPVYWPKWSSQVGGADTAGFDFRSGHLARLGYFVDVGQQFAVTDNVNLGYRFMPTSDAGIGLGMDAKYDYMETPASSLFRSKGEIHALFTTKDRGYWEIYHRQEIWDDTVLLLQSEQWSDPSFYKDFYYDKYKQRTEPRTFANLTYTQPTYLATATIRRTTNNFVAETERAPEITYHLLERPLLEHLYFSFDTVDGYNEREPAGTHAVRFANVGRLTYDLNISEGWNLTPFYEAEATWYSNDMNDEQDSELRFSNELGATLQTRLHKEYPGAFGFSGFKHVIVPSLTYSYRPESNMDVERTPRFDALDNVYGRSRLESKIDNILFGRDEISGETWQVGRLTLYQGNDFWNEFRKSDDYTIEMDIRPRQYLGTQLAWEHHSIQRNFDIDDPFLLQQIFLEVYENVTGHSYDPEVEYRYNARYGDYNRFLSYVYYDDRPLGGKFNGRIGFAYTETQGKVFNREILYGMGYRLSDKWSASFEQRYDLERDKLTQQVYELRRDLHCWEASVQMRERESGWDVNIGLNIKAFPGSRVKF